MTSHTPAVCHVVWLALGILPAHLQGAPGNVDPFFDTASGIEQPVRVLGVQDTGHVVVVGPLMDPDRTIRHRIVRLRSDGRLNRVLDAEVDARATLDSFVLLPDGRILAVAEAMVTEGVSRQGVIRLLPSGGIDSGFATASLVPRRILGQADGRILVELADGRGIVRLQEDGSTDDDFRPGLDPNGVEILGTWKDGHVLVSRFVPTRDGDGMELIRLTSRGDVDATFVGPVVAAIPRSLRTVQPDGAIVLGGVRLRADGTPDMIFDVKGALSRESVDDTWLRAVTAGPGGTLYIGGVIETKHPDFMSGDDAYQQGVVRRLNALDGREDRTFDVQLSGSWPGRPSSVEQVLTQSDGRLLIAGTFTVVQGVTRRFLARLEPDGRLDVTFNANQGADAAVQVLLPLRDGSILVGSGPRQEGGLGGGRGRRPLDFFGPDGGLDGEREVRFPITGREGETVTTLAQQNGDSTLVGAMHTSILRFHSNGSRDTTFVPELEPLGAYVLVTQPDDRILVGAVGFRRQLGSGVDLPGSVIRLHADGSCDPTYGTGTTVSGVVLAMALATSGHLVVGGEFDRISGTSRKNLARLDALGRLDPSFDAEPGPDGAVRCVAIQSDGRLLVGGDFRHFAGTSRLGLVRLHADGRLDTSFDAKLLLSAEPATPRIAAVALQPDGRILIGGLFDRAGAYVRGNVARLLPDGRVDPEFESERGTDGMVLAIGLGQDGRVVIGGEFGFVDGVPRRHLAQLLGRKENEVRLSPGRWLSGRPTFEISSVTPRSVTLEASTNLIDWLPVGSQAIGVDPLVFGDESPSLSGRRFFRATWDP